MLEITADIRGLRTKYPDRFKPYPSNYQNRNVTPISTLSFLHFNVETFYKFLESYNFFPINVLQSLNLLQEELPDYVVLRFAVEWIFQAKNLKDQESRPVDFNKLLNKYIGYTQGCDINTRYNPSNIISKPLLLKDDYITYCVDRFDSLIKKNQPAVIQKTFLKTVMNLLS